MLRLIYAVLLLVNHFASAQSISSLASHQHGAMPFSPATESLAGAALVKPAATSRPIATVILSTKGICKQSMRTVFIIPVADTLFDGGTIAPATEKAASATSTSEACTAEAICTGAGSDELELLLKTPGRFTIPAEEAVPADSSLSPRWPSYILP